MSLKGKLKAGYFITGRVTAIDHILMTAYGVALQNGFEGTEEEWLASLKGEKGDKGDKGDTGYGQDGKDGKDGKDGISPVKGVDYFTEDDVTEIVNQVMQSLNNGDEVSY